MNKKGYFASLLSLFLFIVVATCNAALAKTSVSASRVTLAPNEVYSISLDKINPGSTGRVSCSIGNAKNGGEVLVSTLQSTETGDILVDGNDLGCGFARVIVSQENRKIDILNLPNKTVIRFINITRGTVTLSDIKVWS